MPEPITSLAVASLVISASMQLVNLVAQNIKIKKSTFCDIIYINISESPKLCYAIEEELKLNGYLPDVLSDIEKNFADDEHMKVKYFYYTNWWAKEAVSVLRNSGIYHTEKLVEEKVKKLWDGKPWRKEEHKWENFSDESKKDFLERKKQKITIYKEKDQYIIQLGTIYGYPGILFDFINDIFLKHYIEKNIVQYYFSNNCKWQLPVSREPRDFNKLENNKSMSQVFADLINFSKSEKDYKEIGQPYRRGYLLTGKPGSGKSTIIQTIASISKLDVFMVVLNSQNMTDAVLINLLANVPKNSMIVFEELEKQMISIKENKTVNISTMGILNAIDGPHRLNDGVIVIVTCNDTNLFPKNFKEQLVRKGRIDVEFDIVR